MYNITLHSHQGHYSAIGLELVTDADEKVIYLEFVATPVIARALNAYLQSAEHRDSSELYWNSTFPIRLAMGARYFSAGKLMPCGLMDVALTHPGLGPAGNTAEIFFLAEGGAMPADWPQRLRQALPIGILDEWPARIWDMLTHIPETHSFHEALTRLDSFGDLEVWQLVPADVKLWHRILRELIFESAHG